MRGKYRTQDYYKTKTERDKLYYAAGIPMMYWGPPSKEVPDFKMSSVRDNSPPISVNTQKEWYKRTINGDFFGTQFLFLITSPEDDVSSLRVGFNILKYALESDPMIRVHITESSKHWAKSREETVFMLTNVYDDAPKERVQAIRDWSFAHEDVFRIICAAGDPSVIVRRTKLKFNGIFQVKPYVESVEKSFA
tara:strand:+ start:845 stop:1423 length:579 start_codon:yes stop_codon:yes gene_type:complete